MITVLEINFLVASNHRMFASFQMFQRIASSVSFLKMFIAKISVIHCKRQAVWYYLSPHSSYGKVFKKMF